MSYDNYQRRLLHADEDDYLTVTEAAAIMRISRSAAYRLASGQLPFIRRYDMLAIGRERLMAIVGIDGVDDWLMTPQEIAEVLGCAPATVERWCNEGLGTKVGKQWRVPFKRFRAYAKERWDIDVEPEPSLEP